MILLYIAVGFAILLMSTIILSIMTVAQKQDALQHPTFSNLSSSPTKIIYTHGGITDVSLNPGSVDGSGSVVAELTGDKFEIVIQFSTNYIEAPKSVMLTAATPVITATPTTGYLLTIDNITTSQFEVIGYSPTSVPRGTIFYYTVF